MSYAWHALVIYYHEESIKEYLLHAHSTRRGNYQEAALEDGQMEQFANSPHA